MISSHRLRARRCFGALLLAASAWQCSPDKLVADRILYNAKIITVDPAFSIREAVAIREGIFICVGSNEEVMSYAGKGTELLDLKGHAMVPGLIEGHAHPLAASQSEYFDTIPVVNNIREVLEWIRWQARMKDDDEWIIHPKFFITRMDDMRQISLKELDAAAPRNPVFLNGSYGGMVNTRALQLSEMTGRQHPGILTDESTGLPTGLIRRSAFSLLATPPTPALDKEQQLKALRELLALYNSVGFTSVVSGGGPAEEMEAFEYLRDKGLLTARIFHNIRTPIDARKSQDDLLEDLRKLGPGTGEGDAWVRTGAFKIVLDGGMLTGTAFLHEPWGEKAKDLYGINDPSYRGELMFSKAELVKVITAADAAGWKFTAHVTGGGGVDTLLAAYEAVHANRSIRGKRFSVIHGNFFTEEAIAKMARMDVYADMQPAWFYKDADLLQYVLGARRLETFHPYGSLFRAGVVVNAGSDHMVKTDPDDAINPYNPFTAMWSIITRKTLKGSAFNPEEPVSREAALKMYTINNAFASFEEDIKGSIEKGKLADFVVLSDDLLTCPEDAIRTLRPLLTVVGGNTVYTTGKLEQPPAVSP